MIDPNTYNPRILPQLEDLLARLAESGTPPREIRAGVLAFEVLLGEADRSAKGWARGPSHSRPWDEPRPEALVFQGIPVRPDPEMPAGQIKIVAHDGG